MPTPLNILYLHSHDTGRCIQPYGHAVATPALQRLAGQGVLFRQAFCAGPTCSPSRGALLTGMCPHSAGILGLVNMGFRIADDRQHIAAVLREAGYTAALSGVQHVVPQDRIVAYEELLTPGRTADAQIAEAAAGWLSRAHERPFFLSVGFHATHRRFPEPGELDDPRWCLPAAPLPDAPATRADMAAFHTSVRGLDGCMGRVLEALDAAGLAERTLVVCTTDHGIAFPHMKCNLTDHGIGVMMILRSPGGFAGGRACDAMVSQIDVVPTICELAGIDAPPWVEGRSLLPLVRGEADEIHEEIFAEVSYHVAYEPMRAVRTRRWKYIRRFHDRRTPMLNNCDDSPSKTLLVESGWRDRPVEAEQLFDLAFDPAEACNLAAEPAHAATLARMRGRLEAWMRRTNDPLLRGPVPAPSGAKVGDPDALSPGERLRVVP